MLAHGVFGIATKYSESLIGVKYRVKTSDGRMLGGAMYALERGFKFKTLGKILAVLFALLHCLHPSALVRVFRLMRFQTL